MLEELQAAHLCNAVRKLRARRDGGEKLDEYQTRLLSEMEEEVVARGLDLAYPSGKPPQETGPGPAIM
jgi:hypothetical protein